ncbi:antibiotic biosynthesis monooxygenase [Furfurilactobacillus sp. WILCCON 0119]|uniref:antibiotic biosynthesis monooxygenase n=1 Tax=Furfurilactobacillus entadae TaxID=2922307 RepID=UPI0035E48148
MTRSVSLTFGTKPILQKIQADSPHGQLMALSETSGVARLMLLDVSDRENRFANPISFNVLAERPRPEYHDFFSFINLQLDPDHAKILRASVDHFLDQDQPLGLGAFLLLENTKSPSDYLLLSSWEQVTDYHAWLSSPEFSVFTPFYKQTQYNYREVAYKRTSLDKA